MESGGTLHSDEFPDPEAEMAARLDDADKIIYPAFLATLNAAKIDYNTAASRYTDMPTRIMLARKYLDILKKGSILGSQREVIKDICVKRPELALVLEHSAYLTIDWLELINGLQVCSHEPDFVAWANSKIKNEHFFLDQIKLVAKEIDVQFAKGGSQS